MPLSEDRLAAWERREGPALAVLPYGLLAISAILTVLVGGGTKADMGIDLVLAGMAAAWMLWMVALHPAWSAGPGRAATYFAGLIALMAALVLRAPWFGFFALSGSIAAFRALSGAWLVVGLALVAVVQATAQDGGLPQHGAAALATYAIIVAINLLIVGALNWFAWIGHELSLRRARALADLVEANGRLEVSLRENAGLHAQLLAQAREAGILDERQRMAREIHDTLAQGFTGIIAQLEAARRARRQPGDWQVHVDQAQLLARESLVEARRSVQALRPEPLEGDRLPDALAGMARRWSGVAGVAVSCMISGEPRALLPEIEVALFRIAQEALTNVARHARASRVGLTLSYMDDLVLLDVRDDGVGFVVGSGITDGRMGEGQGFGLSAMRQRARQVAGSLEVESGPGEGTAINASVPALPAGGGR